MDFIVMMALWITGFAASVAFFIAKAVDYKKNKGTKKPVIIAGIVSVVLSVPLILLITLLAVLSTGIAGM